MSSKMSLNEYTAGIHYYLRKDLFYEAMTMAKEAHKSYDDVNSGLWSAFAAFKCGSKNEANAILSTLERQKENSPMHLRLRNIVNNEKENRIDSVSRQSMSDAVLCSLSILSLYLDNVKEAKDMMKTTSSSSYSTEQALAMVELKVHEKSRFQKDSMTKLTSSLDKARRHLTQAQDMKPDHPLTLLLLIELEERSKNIKEMSNWYSKLLQVIRDEEILLLEKANIMVINQKWDQIGSVLEILQSKYPNNLQGMRFKLFEVLVSSGSVSQAIEIYSQICFSIEKNYGWDNVKLLLETVALVSRITGKNTAILNHSLQILLKAKKVLIDNYYLLTELGYAYILSGDLTAAEECYKKAGKINAEQTETFLRLVQIKLYQGEIEEAEATLDFFKEISATLNKECSEIYFLEAFLCFAKAEKLESQLKIGQNGITPALKSNENRKTMTEDMKESELLFRKSNELFDNAIRSHVAATKNYPNNMEFYIQFNPSFLLELSQFFIKDVEVCYTYAKLGIQQIKVPESVFNKSIKILEILVQKIPGLMAGYINLIKAYTLSSNYTMAEVYVAKVFHIDPLNQQTHIFSLLISLMKANMTENVEEATKCLNNASSSNFELLQNPEFQFLKGQVEILTSNYPSAKKSLAKAKQIIEELGHVESTNDVQGKGNGKFDSPSRSRISGNAGPQDQGKKTSRDQTKKVETGVDQPTLKRWKEFLKPEIECCRAVLHALMNEMTEASDLIQECISEYFSSENSIFVVLANSDIALIKKDVKMAMDILKNVESTDHGYVVAQRKLSDIYLNSLKQYRAYIQCFQNINDHLLSRESKRQLAEAYFRIGEYDDAQLIFQEIEKDFEPTEELTLRIGECLMRTHNFIQARNYFARNVASNIGCLSYRVFLCEILRRTQNYQEIVNYIDFTYIRGTDGFAKLDYTDINDLEIKVKAAILLYEHFMHAYNAFKNDKLFQSTIESLELASEIQKKLIEELKSRHLKLDSARRTLGDISYKLLLLNSNNGSEFNSLLPYLEESIKNDPSNVNYHIMHGNIYWNMDDLDIAKEKAKQILKNDFKNPKAIQLFADCLLQGQQFEMGMKGFFKIFEKDKLLNNAYSILPVLFWFYRSVGKLDEFKSLYESHTKAKANSTIFEITDSAISFSNGLYNYAIRNFNLAIEELSKARQSSEFAGPASLILIDIYFHDSSYNIYSNFFNRDKFKAFNKNHLKTIRLLIDELSAVQYQQERQIYYLVIESFEDNLKMAANAKALEDLLGNSSFKIYHSLILYFTVIFHLKMKTKENLKDLFVRIRNLVYKPKKCFDEYYFRSLLLCCDTLLFKDKIKPAKALIDICLTNNRSCLQAYEYLMIFNDKNGDNNTEILKTAFNITGQQDPNIGYRLAKNLMTDGSTVESFKICKSVLSKYPKFKSIEQDVLLQVREDLINNY
jgi:predicted Zn-dependent protease